MSTTITLPYPPYTTKLTDESGMMSQPWIMWTQQLYQAVGGTTPINPSIPSQTLVSNYASNVFLVNNVVQPFYITPVAIVKTILDSFVAKNNSTLPNTLSIWVVPQGQTPNSTNNVLMNSPIAAGATVNIQAVQNQILGTGAYLVVQAQTPGVVLCTLMGRQIS